MLRIRRFEEKCFELYQAQKIRGFMHLYDGEEAVSVGVIEALNRGRDRRDLSRARPGTGTWRWHGAADGRNVWQGRRAAAGGAAARCTFLTARTRFYGGNAIVGGGLPLAVGIALGDKMLGRNAVTACFFGDGAVDEGEFHECMNLAALWKLPVLFVCENNLYAMGMALERAEAETHIARKAAAYRMPSEAVDGMDVVAVEAAARRAIDNPSDRRAAFLRMPHLPLSGPFDVRRAALPHEAGNRALAQAAIRSALPILARADRADACGRHRRDRGRNCRGDRRAPLPSPRRARWEPVDDLERFTLMDQVPP